MYGASCDDGFCQVLMINAILFSRPVAQQVKLCNCSRAPITGGTKVSLSLENTKGTFCRSLFHDMQAFKMCKKDKKKDI